MPKRERPNQPSGSEPGKAARKPEKQPPVSADQFLEKTGLGGSAAAGLAASLHRTEFLSLEEWRAVTAALLEKKV